MRRWRKNGFGFVVFSRVALFPCRGSKNYWTDRPPVLDGISSGACLLEDLLQLHFLVFCSKMLGEPFIRLQMLPSEDRGGRAAAAHPAEARAKLADDGAERGGHRHHPLRHGALRGAGRRGRGSADRVVDPEGFAKLVACADALIGSTGLIR